MTQLTFGTTSLFISSFIFYKPDHSSLHQPSSTSTERVDDHAEYWIKFHDSINPTSKPSKSKIRGATSILTETKTAAVEIKRLESLASVPKQQKVSSGIDKNSTLATYQDSCIEKGIPGYVTTAIKCKTSPPPTYPSHYQLIANCKMKPSSNLYYRVKDLRLDNVIIFVVRNYESYLSDDELLNLKSLNSKYCEMINDVLRLRFVDFSSLKIPLFGYADQAIISQEQVELATACAIKYGLHTGMVIRYLKRGVRWREP